MGWREYAAERLASGDNRDVRANSTVSGPVSGPIVPIVPIVLPLDASRSLKSWWAGLSSVDPLKPPEGFGQGRWATLYDASIWWLDAFGLEAASEGWETADVFGVRPAFPGLGGLVDRLGHGRTLIMTPDLARWRWLGVGSSYARGTYPDLRPFWSAGR
jgi:hypothetical protein